MDDVIFRDELLALDAADNGFELVLALTRDGSRRAGDYSRRVDAAMIRDVLARVASHPRYVFVCGSNPFVEAASQGLIDVDIAAALIRTERYEVSRVSVFYMAESLWPCINWAKFPRR